MDNKQITISADSMNSELHNDQPMRLNIDGKMYKSVTHYIYSSMMPTDNMKSLIEIQKTGLDVRNVGSTYLFGKSVKGTKKLPAIHEYTMLRALENGYRNLFAKTGKKNPIRDSFLGTKNPFVYSTDFFTFMDGDNTSLGINNAGNGDNKLGALLNQIRQSIRKEELSKDKYIVDNENKAFKVQLRLEVLNNELNKGEYNKTLRDEIYGIIEPLLYSGDTSAITTRGFKAIAPVKGWKSDVNILKREVAKILSILKDHITNEEFKSIKYDVEINRLFRIQLRQVLLIKQFDKGHFPSDISLKNLYMNNVPIDDDEFNSILLNRFPFTDRVINYNMYKKGYINDNIKTEFESGNSSWIQDEYDERFNKRAIVIVYLRNIGVSYDNLRLSLAKKKILDNYRKSQFTIENNDITIVPLTKYLTDNNVNVDTLNYIGDESLVSLSNQIYSNYMSNKYILSDKFTEEVADEIRILKTKYQVNYDIIIPKIDSIDVKFKSLEYEEIELEPLSPTQTYGGSTVVYPNGVCGDESDVCPLGDGDESDGDYDGEYADEPQDDDDGNGEDYDEKVPKVLKEKKENLVKKYTSDDEGGDTDEEKEGGEDTEDEDTDDKDLYDEDYVNVEDKDKITQIVDTRKWIEKTLDSTYEPRIESTAQIVQPSAEVIKFSKDITYPYEWLSPCYISNLKIDGYYYPSISHYVFAMIATPIQVRGEETEYSKKERLQGKELPTVPETYNIIENIEKKSVNIDFSKNIQARLWVQRNKNYVFVASKKYSKLLKEKGKVVFVNDDKLYGKIDQFVSFQEMFDDLPERIKKITDLMYLRFANRALYIKMNTSPYRQLLKDTEPYDLLYLDNNSKTAIAGREMVAILKILRSGIKEKDVPLRGPPIMGREVVYKYDDKEVKSHLIYKYIMDRTKDLVKSTVLFTRYRLEHDLAKSKKIASYKIAVKEEEKDVPSLGFPAITFSDLKYILKNFYSVCDGINYNTFVTAAPSDFIVAFENIVQEQVKLYLPSRTLYRMEDVESKDIIDKYRKGEEQDLTDKIFLNSYDIYQGIWVHISVLINDTISELNKDNLDYLFQTKIINASNEIYKLRMGKQRDIYSWAIVDMLKSLHKWTPDSNEITNSEIKFINDFLTVDSLEKLVPVIESDKYEKYELDKRVEEVYEYIQPLQQIKKLGGILDRLMEQKDNTRLIVKLKALYYDRWSSQ